MSKRARTLARSPRRKLAAILGVLALVAIGLTVVSTSSAAPAPVNTVAPDVSGVAQQGKTLTTTNGTWTSVASGGITGYQYNWQRCNPDATGCANIAGAISTTYTIGQADVGSVLRSVVIAMDANGDSSPQPSAITATVVSAASLAPLNTVPPTISGTPSNGQTLTIANGTWTGAAPITYTYAWQLCDATGNACVPIQGATASTYLLASTAVGKTLRAVVTASNANGTQTATTVPTSVIDSAAPTTLVKLPNGKTSIDASEVKGSARLILSTFKVQQTQPLHTRAPFKVTFTVTDTRGYVVRNALVYVIGLPYNRILTTPEVRSAQDGTASFNLTPTKLQPLKTGARLVIFARARVDGDSLLAGASTRRLVEVVFGAAH
jgi:hypothetical protein